MHTFQTQKFTLHIEGTRQLLMHNGRLANPLDPAAKALKARTSKRSKTEENYEEIAYLEFLGSLYTDPDAGPYLPGENIWRSLYDGAKKHKLGEKVKAGLLINTVVNPISYPGSRDPEKLWENENFRFVKVVKVNSARTVRCRARFSQWATDVEGQFDPSVLDKHEIERIADTAGAYVGLGDWRPQNGTYVAEIEYR
jgi:hypothetical protein